MKKRRVRTGTSHGVHQVLDEDVADVLVPHHTHLQRGEARLQQEYEHEVENLQVDIHLTRLCGWTQARFFAPRVVRVGLSLLKIDAGQFPHTPHTSCGSYPLR